MMENSTEALTSVASSWPPVPGREEQLEWGNTANKIMGGLTILIGLLGFSTNIVVIIMFLKIRSLLNPTNVFILSLSACNLALSVFGIPLSASSNLAGRWLFFKAGCIWYGFANTFFGLASIANHTAIAIHRYLVICTQSAGKNLTNGKAAVWSVCAWLYGFCWAFFPVVGWGRYDFEGPGTWCSVDWHGKDLVSTTYFASLFTFCFFLPVFVIGAMYGAIFRKVRQARRQTSHDALQKINLKRERRIVKLTLTIYFAFMLAWLPYSVTSLITISGYGSILSNWTLAMPALFAKTSTIYNPIIYAGMSATFRTAVRQVLSGFENVLFEKESTGENVPLKGHGPPGNDELECKQRIGTNEKYSSSKNDDSVECKFNSPSNSRVLPSPQISWGREQPLYMRIASQFTILSDDATPDEQTNTARGTAASLCTVTKTDATPEEYCDRIQDQSTVLRRVDSTADTKLVGVVNT